MPAVVSPLHDNDVFALRDRAGKPQCLISSFAAGIEQLNGLCGRNMLAYQFCKLSLEEGSARAKQTGAVSQYVNHRVGDVRIVVAKKMRRKCGMVIDVTIPFCIVDVRTFTLHKYDRGLRRSIHGHNAAGNELAVPLKNALGYWV